MAKKDLNPEGKKKLDASDLISKIDEFKEKERLVKTSEILKNEEIQLVWPLD